MTGFKQKRIQQAVFPFHSRMIPVGIIGSFDQQEAVYAHSHISQLSHSDIWEAMAFYTAYIFWQVKEFLFSVVW